MNNYYDENEYEGYEYEAHDCEPSDDDCSTWGSDLTGHVVTYVVGRIGEKPTGLPPMQLKDAVELRDSLNKIFCVDYFAVYNIETC